MTTLHDAPAPGAEAAPSAAALTPRRRTGRWIDDWTPEDPQFWENGGRSPAATCSGRSSPSTSASRSG